MAETHTFKLTSAWDGDSDGSGQIVADGWTVPYSVPPTLGGEAGRANPEELLLGAVVSCYCITLAYLAERRRLPLQRIEMSAEAEIERQLGGTLKFTGIRLIPRLLAPASDEAQARGLEECAHKAEQYCLVSAALRGNVNIEVKPEVVGSG